MSKHTTGPWRIGKNGAIVADVPIQEPPIGNDDVDYYGGYLICESVAVKNKPLIAAAPEMFDALEAVLLFYSTDWNEVRRRCWHEITGSQEATTKVLCDHIRKLRAKVEAAR